MRSAGPLYGVAAQPIAASCFGSGYRFWHESGVFQPHLTQTPAQRPEAVLHHHP